MKFQEHILDFFGMEFITFFVCYLLDGNPAYFFYHSITEAANMYIRSLGIPALAWIDDLLSMTEQLYIDCSDNEQFESCMKSMVIVTRILSNAG